MEADLRGIGYIVSRRQNVDAELHSASDLSHVAARNMIRSWILF